MRRQQHDPNAAVRRIKSYIKTLNKRLNAHGISVRFDRDSRHILICRPAVSQGECSIYLSEIRYRKLMTYNNSELAAYFKTWHRNNFHFPLKKVI